MEELIFLVMALIVVSVITFAVLDISRTRKKIIANAGTILDFGGSLNSMLNKNPHKKAIIEKVFKYAQELVNTAENVPDFNINGGDKESVNELKHAYVKKFITDSLVAEGIDIDKDLNKLIDLSISFTVNYILK